MRAPNQMTTAEPGRVAEAALLLEILMRWERGETPPGKTLTDLKAKGLRDLLESLASTSGTAPS